MKLGLGMCSSMIRCLHTSALSNLGKAGRKILAILALLMSCWMRILRYNDCVSKTKMHTGVHLCRGNFIGGRHFAEGAYDIIST